MLKSCKVLVGAMLWTGLAALQAQAASAPVYHEVIPVELSYGGLSPGLYTAPYAVDLNADDRIDLVVGDADGQVIACYNSRPDGIEIVYAETVYDAVTGAPLRFIGPARPVVVDVLADGWLDLAVGEGDGGLQLCNLNSYERPLRMWCHPVMYEEAPLTAPGGHAAPTAVDLFLRGVLDLVLGAGDGRMYLYLNLGTNEAPELMYIGPLAEWTGAGVVDVGRAATPSLADLNQDGALDLVAGAADGAITICRGPTGPCFPLILHDQNDLRAANFGAYSVPSIADFNSDGILDIVVGNAAGEVYWLPGHELRSSIVQVPGETDEMYQARLASAVLEETAGVFAMGERPSFPGEEWMALMGSTSPVAMDADGWAGPDVGLADGSGSLTILYNRGTKAPDFYYAESDFRDQWGLPLTFWGAPRPMLMDVSGDGLLDLVAGVADELQLCITQSYERPLTFDCRSATMTNGRPLTAQRPAPTAGDLDGDGVTDFLLGMADGQLHIYHNHGTEAQPEFQHQSLFNPPGKGRVDVGENAVPVISDLDGDGENDLLVGAADGRLTFCPQLTGACLPIISYAADTWGPVDVGEDAAPMVADFNGDGQPDLMVGNLAGELWYFAADWVLQHEE